MNKERASRSIQELGDDQQNKTRVRKIHVTSPLSGSEIRRKLKISKKAHLEVKKAIEAALGKKSVA